MKAFHSSFSTSLHTHSFPVAISIYPQYNGGLTGCLHLSLTTHYPVTNFKNSNDYLPITFSTLSGLAEIPKGISVNSYKCIEQPLNAVVLMSLSSITSWRYPCARSNEEKKTNYYCRHPAGLCQFLVVGSVSYCNEIKFPVIHAQTNFPCPFCTITTWDA